MRPPFAFGKGPITLRGKWVITQTSQNTSAYPGSESQQPRSSFVASASISESESACALASASSQATASFACCSSSIPAFVDYSAASNLALSSAIRATSTFRVNSSISATDMPGVADLAGDHLPKLFAVMFGFRSLNRRKPRPRRNRILFSVPSVSSCSKSSLILLESFGNYFWTIFRRGAIPAGVVLRDVAGLEIPGI